MGKRHLRVFGSGFVPCAYNIRVDDGLCLQQLAEELGVAFEDVRKETLIHRMVVVLCPLAAPSASADVKYQIWRSLRAVREAGAEDVAGAVAAAPDILEDANLRKRAIACSLDLAVEAFREIEASFLRRGDTATCERTAAHARALVRCRYCAAPRSELWVGGCGRQLERSDSVRSHFFRAALPSCGIVGRSSGSACRRASTFDLLCS